jgi:CRP-like cAMP-binding protein
VLRAVEARAVVGDIAAFDGQPRSATVRARTPCTVFSIGATDFRALEMFAALGIVYVTLVFALSALAARLERRLNRPYAA